MSGIPSEERFTLVRQVAGNRIGFWSVPGEVVAVDRWTETKVSSSHGSVSIIGNNVAVSVPRVWASAVARKAIWIKTDATELQIPVPEDFAIRTGHRVDAVAASLTDGKSGQWSAIVNHDTGRWCQVDRVPPGGAYDWWTNFVVGFGQGFGNLFVGAMILYAVPFTLIFGVMLHSGWSGLLTGMFFGAALGFTHAVVGVFMSRGAITDYSAAVKVACDGVFATEKA